MAETVVYWAILVEQPLLSRDENPSSSTQAGSTVRLRCHCSIRMLFSARAKGKVTFVTTFPWCAPTMTAGVAVSPFVPDQLWCPLDSRPHPGTLARPGSKREEWCRELPSPRREERPLQARCSLVGDACRPIHNASELTDSVSLPEVPEKWRDVEDANPSCAGHREAVLEQQMSWLTVSDCR